MRKIIAKRLYINKIVLCLIGLFAIGFYLHSPSLAVGDEVTMYVMNSSTAKKRIQNGKFSVVYRGFGSTRPERLEQDELLGFKFLIGTDCDSHGVRSLQNKYKKSGLSSSQAQKKARKEHTRLLIKYFNKHKKVKNLYENYKNKSQTLKASGEINPESHFIYTTPHLGIARLYGPVVMVIEEMRPRGMDLNGIAKDSNYYSLAQILKNVSNLSFKCIVSDYVADRDEYVIPSFLPSRDIKSLIIYKPNKISKKGIIIPRVKRIYKKHYKNGRMIIDVLDHKDRLINRLSAHPTKSVITPKNSKSATSLPTSIQAEWTNYVKSLRKR